MGIGSEQVMDIMRQMMLVCMQMAGPLLLVSIAIGLIISIFQAATQIHEQTLTFVPKLIIIALMLLLLGNWFNSVLGGFTKDMFKLLETV